MLGAVNYHSERISTVKISGRISRRPFTFYEALHTVRGTAASAHTVPDDVLEDSQVQARVLVHATLNGYVPALAPAHPRRCATALLSFPDPSGATARAHRHVRDRHPSQEQDFRRDPLRCRGPGIEAFKRMGVPILDLTDRSMMKCQNGVPLGA